MVKKKVTIFTFRTHSSMHVGAEHSNFFKNPHHGTTFHDVGFKEVGMFFFFKTL